MSYVAVAIVPERLKMGRRIPLPIFSTREAAAAALFKARSDVAYCLTGTPPYGWDDIEVHKRPQAQ